MKGMSEEYYQRLIKDLNLRIDNLEFQRNMKQEKLEQLQSNWNSLREWLNTRIQANIIRTGMRSEELLIVLDKMNELEGKNEK